MKIAILNKYQDKVNRGAETYVKELSKRLSVNHQVDVISNVNYFDLYRKKYDLIIPTNGRLQVITVRMITWLTHTRLVVSGQSGKGWDDRLNIYAMPDAFVALSSFAESWAKKINPLVKVVCIPNGVDILKFKPRDSENKNRTKTILSVGAFTEQKRHDLVIRAVSKIKDVNLIIAGGGGEDKEKIKTLGNRLLPNRFKLIETTNDKMPDVYKSSDLFTLASRPSESFGIVLVEAMACGLSVVATNDPIRKEIVGEAGLFVDPTDINKYAETLEKALSINWKDIPRKQSLKFSWDQIALEYEKLFSDLSNT